MKAIWVLEKSDYGYFSIIFITMVLSALKFMILIISQRPTVYPSTAKFSQNLAGYHQNSTM